MIIGIFTIVAMSSGKPERRLADKLEMQEELERPPLATDHYARHSLRQPPAATEPDARETFQQSPAATDPDAQRVPRETPATGDPDAQKDFQQSPATTGHDAQKDSRHTPATTGHDAQRVPQQTPVSKMSIPGMFAGVLLGGWLPILVHKAVEGTSFEDLLPKDEDLSKGFMVAGAAVGLLLGAWSLKAISAVLFGYIVLVACLSWKNYKKRQNQEEEVVSFM